ncbi:hypothetical protein H6G18_15795 [Anabaena subtropica FACHB-260]|uniref:Uncharacterized protein n=2 Tax=Anabaena TaxID=1163 RepID=A0ABR8CQX3_9NOST|nr:hypothetical protein [Anabaena subtropica FACHB-260]
MSNTFFSISETFCDLRIPEGFSSPEQLVTALIRFQNLLLSQNTIFADVFEHYQVENKEPPFPVFEIHRINNEVLSAVNYALSLDEVYPYLYKKDAQETLSEQAVNRLVVICRRFHLVARQLERRRLDNSKARETLKIKDEYDVQDLLNSLLKVDFDDVRSEEWTPSYAGSSSRVDFLLKAEKIVIEVKKTRETLTDKKIGEELAIDIIRYNNHPDCKYLFCFIYDPDGYLNNPNGLVNDLKNSGSDNLNVIAVVNP